MIKHAIKLIFVFTFSSSLVSGQSAIKNLKKNFIDLKTIDYAELRNHSGQKDSIQTIRKKMPKKDLEHFSNNWNNSNSQGSCIFVVSYWVDLYLKNDTIRTFRINGQNIKEKTDFCYQIKEKEYFDKLWKSLK